MIEKIVKDYLLTQFDIPVNTDRPADSPDEFILVERVGGSIENFARTARIAIQSYALTRLAAVEIHERVLEVMPEMNTVDGGVYLDSEYDFTDTETKYYRYQAVFEITYF